MYSGNVGGMMPQQYHLPPGKMATVTKDSSLRGGNPFYPRRLAYILSTLKILCGCGLVVLGSLALYQKASYARSASGLWGGIMVIISGVLGVFSVRMNAARGYVVAFFAACVLALLADVLVIIYAATGLAKDSGFPGGFVRDDLTGDLIPVSQVNIPAREKAMLVNLLLIIVGVLEILFTLPSFIICLREACQCYNPELLLPDQYIANNYYGERGVRNDWLMTWLGQQNQVFYSSASGIPYTKVSPYHHPHLLSRSTPPFVLLPSDHSQQGSSQPKLSPANMHPAGPMRHPHSHSSRHGQSPRESHRSDPASVRTRSPPSASVPQASRSSGRRSTRIPHFTPLEVYPPHFYYAAAPPAAPSYPSPGSNMSHPSMAQLVPLAAPPASSGQWIFGDEFDPQTMYMDRPAGQRYSRRAGYDESGRRKRGRSKSNGRDGRKVKKRNGPTDSDLDRTYTGLDRELAEEFIEQTMDPAIVLERSNVSTSNAPQGQSHASGAGSPSSPGIMSGTESEAW